MCTSDLTAEHYVQGPHKSADSVVAKRLDFETIDFDQFGEQPPELPLSDDVDEELIELELDQNGEDANVTAKESHRNKAGELQSQFEQTKEQEERTTHMFASLLNIDTKLEQGKHTTSHWLLWSQWQLQLAVLSLPHFHSLSVVDMVTIY